MPELEVRWKNFRGFEDTGWIRFRPLTLLLGPNNSGKTSLMVPLLLLKQTHDSDEPDVPLQTKGPFLNAGSFRDIVFRHEVRREMKFAIRFHHHEIANVIKARPLGEDPPGEIELTFKHQKPEEDPILQKYQVLDTFSRPMLTRRRTKSGTYTLEGLTYVTRRNKSRHKSSRFDTALRRNIRNARPFDFRFNDYPFSQTLQEESSGAGPIELSPFASEYLQVVESVSKQIFKLFFDVHYIGPLREKPKRLYELSGATPSNVGIRGEFAPEMLFRDQSLIPEIGQWLRRFDFLGSIRGKRMAEGAFSLYLGKTKAGIAVNLADTGFGLSQILPLIVQGIFSANEPELIIAEQPEIHLNPRLQAILGDLFCAIARNGPTLVIETHSEHLVLRIRRLIAEGKFSAQDVALYFVEREAGRSLIQEVPIQTNGHILSKDWPQGFFGESLGDALALASAQGRRKKR